MYRSICVSIDPNSATGELPAMARQLAEAEEGALTAAIADGRDAKAARLARLGQAPTGGSLESPPGPTPATTSKSDGIVVRHLSGRPHRALIEELNEGGYDLAIIPAMRADEGEGDGLGSICGRVLRRAHVDTLVLKEDSSDSDEILVCVDGSKESYAGLMTAIKLSRRFNKKLRAVAVYDPYLHYTLFNGIVNVLSEKAASVFKFQDQEKLHEEIIDTGLAKIYQAHLEVAGKVAQAEGADIELTLLDGKAFEKIRQLVHKRRPWLMIVGRIGVHSAEGMDLGATTENLLEAAPCNVLVMSQTYVPPVDVKAEASVQWTPEALKKTERIPSFVRGVATTAILRWATERGHSVITPSVINSAMGDLLPPAASQAMGYVAEEAAIQLDNLAEGITFICTDCGWSIRDVRPPKCSVCAADGAKMEQLDRSALEKIGKLETGALEVEETFDGKRLQWQKEAQAILRRVPSGYQRRRSKARIEKTARVRGLETITREFALDVVEQDLAETSYLSSRGEVMQVEVRPDERPDDAEARPREDSEFVWTDAAWVRLERVPPGFMRDMTRQRIEGFATDKGYRAIDLERCELGIAEGRRVMAEMIGAYGYDGATKEILKNINEEGGPKAVQPPEPVVEAKAEVKAAPEPVASGCPMHSMRGTEEAEAKPTTTPAPVAATATPAPAQVAGAAPEPVASGCPFHAQKPEGEAQAAEAKAPGVEWTPTAEQMLEQAAERAAEAGKFTEDRARSMSKNVAEKRAGGYDMAQIAEGFMRKLGKQLGYGHPLSELTTEHEFEWTPEALARLDNVPDFCRELTKWRVEWTAVKKDLGRVITPEIMSTKYDMWGEVSDQIMDRSERTVPWSEAAWSRIANIPSFVVGPVVQSVEGSAKEWGAAEVTPEILDRVIQKWIDTGDFHEGQFGYKA